MQRPMASISSNGFGAESYWNQPPSKERSKRSSRSLSPTHRDSNIQTPAHRDSNIQRPLGRLTADNNNQAPASSSATDSKADLFQSSTNDSNADLVHFNTRSQSNTRLHRPPPTFLSNCLRWPKGNGSLPPAVASLRMTVPFTVSRSSQPSRSKSNQCVPNPVYGSVVKRSPEDAL